MNNKSKLISSMKGIEPIKLKNIDPKKPFQNISTGNYDPPAYIVAYIFFNILKFKDYGPSEKVWWHTYFNYKGIDFLIRDYKFGSWSIETKINNDSSKKYVLDIKGKIKCAAHYADEMIQNEFKVLIQNGHFYINNRYNVLLSIFNFYLEETHKAIKAIEEHETKEIPEKQDIYDLTGHIKKHYKLLEILSYRAMPLINSFYSLLEFILDVFYAFQRPNMNFFEFRDLSWQERFKKVIDIKSLKEFTKIYEKLVEIKKNYRNPLSHGLAGESSLLISFPFAGLVPISYQHLKNSIYYGSIQISIDLAKQIISMFNDFFKLINSEEPYSYYILYAEYGFSIPISKIAIQKIVKEMNDYESFKEYLLMESRYQDEIINRDVPL